MKRRPNHAHLRQIMAVRFGGVRIRWGKVVWRKDV